MYKYAAYQGILALINIALVSGCANRLPTMVVFLGRFCRSEMHVTIVTGALRGKFFGDWVIGHH